MAYYKDKKLNISCEIILVTGDVQKVEDFHFNR